MALETQPAWSVALKDMLAQPPSPDELVRLRAWVQRVRALNAGQTWEPGTFQRLLDRARAEDAARGG